MYYVELYEPNGIITFIGKYSTVEMAKNTSVMIAMSEPKFKNERFMAYDEGGRYFINFMNIGYKYIIEKK